MKDLNELMQAILEMDAAQRRAADAALAERQEELAALSGKQELIAQQGIERAQRETARALAARRQREDVVLGELQQKQQAAAQRMQETVDANRDSWIAELVQRTLER